jgi:acyl-CoA reductase-like NAD-dependent aldehyde dehydrogenase
MILAKLGITEEDLKKMPPEEREKVMEKIRDMMKKEIEAQKQLEEMQKDKKIRVSV